ncbi:MAG TPA: hypothetical protein VGD56_05115, partial [Gemmatirosa sp.]
MTPTHTFTIVRLDDGRRAVVKRPVDGAPDGAADRLLWEGSCLTRLTEAPRVLRCYRVERAPPALVLEYAAGGSLAGRLRDGPAPGVGRLLGAREVAAIGAALGAALASVHAAGM